ncbi:MAG: Glycosyl transferase, family 4, conserved region-containing protein [Desulfotomaculum sp. 46_296]|nr:MAG: Glycosyl transferase, family 4, conserved region-containing protein [Desulfotomaculum sp. 46_296]KUK84873.1 MAG: Glycosyl transferase, family 4, conserved region-containing protein [Desulfofundulus kuznetsovii]HAU31642.1 undecaprenyl-phosphate alpha-N-acetylglucosaminyl 1-phosphate transferase [Desulfotomaculum sp.]
MEKLLAPVLAFFLALLITPAVRKLAFAWGAVDLPNPRKVHQHVMPRLGGLAIYVAFVIPLFLTMPVSLFIGLITGISLIVLIGVIDDIKGISPWLKLGGQILAAYSLIMLNIQIGFVTNPFNGHIIPLGWWGIPITIFWVVAVTNAVNLIDGLDGLAGGVSCIAALTIAAVGWTQWKIFGITGQQEIIMLALILAAAIIGFLWHNVYPASIFLGDTGSMLLGFSLAAVSVLGLTKSAAAVSIFIPLVILGIPLFDVVLAVFRRYHLHKPIFQADREHIHHQLMNLGLNQRQTVAVICGISFILGISAVVLNIVTSDQAMILLVILAGLGIILAGKIGLFSVSKRTSRTASRNSSQHL